ncbi:hypothetical protein [Azotobacter beijerinckii]|uniref:hypothetical protein n=1 Tax=Azotobacter beijerinckii TaxID=170623 RepID=UPI0011602BF6|nr:hypothetical protein [Azotobacter beijerinckii]
MADIALSCAVIKRLHQCGHEFMQFGCFGSSAPREGAATASKQAGDFIGEGNCLANAGEVRL